MKTLLNNNNKLENAVNMDKVNQIIRKQPSQRNKMICIDLNDSQNVGNEVLKLCQFEVQSDGHYNINLQLALKNNSQNNVTLTALQYGICQDDLQDFEKAFNSNVSNSSVASEYIVSNNLSTTKYLEKGKQYCAWCSIGANYVNCMMYDKDYSHLMLLKLSE